MDWDEARPKPQGARLGENLATLSVGELEARIEALEAEIVRVKAELERKRAHEAAAARLVQIVSCSETWQPVFQKKLDKTTARCACRSFMAPQGARDERVVCRSGSAH